MKGLSAALTVSGTGNARAGSARGGNEWAAIAAGSVAAIGSTVATSGQPVARAVKSRSDFPA